MDADLFDARVKDTASLCERTSVPKFLGFLTPSEAASAEAILKKLNVKHRFFGGFDGAERTMLCCMPQWCDDPDFPITAFTLNFRKCDKLSRRDFLGSLMGLGITRESVGDILADVGRAVIFVTDEIAPFVSSQLLTVGRVGVKISNGYSEPLPQFDKQIECTDTVASARLDCIVGAIAGWSRSTACEAIAGSLVAVNSIGCEKITRTVSEGDRISIKGKGRFDIVSVSGVSKKGRIILKYKKFL